MDNLCRPTYWGRVGGRPGTRRATSSSLMKRQNVILELGIQIWVFLVIL